MFIIKQYIYMYKLYNRDGLTCSRATWTNKIIPKAKMFVNTFYII